MNVTLKRLSFIAGLFGILGFTAHMFPIVLATPRTEAWMEQTLPSSLPGYTLQHLGGNDPSVSYRMDPRTYSLLNPYGIVARDFMKDNKTYDSVVVMGNKTENFHDPNLCFPAQDWKIITETPQNVTLKSGEVIHMTLMKLQFNGDTHYACYFFNGPIGTYGTMKDLNKGVMLNALLTGKPFQGAFYRFMTQTSSDTVAHLLQFTTDYLNNVPKAAELG